MILKVKHRSSYYRRFQLDIWGLLRTTLFYRPAPVGPSVSDWNRYYGSKKRALRLQKVPRIQAHWMDDIRPSAVQRLQKKNPKQKYALAPWAYASRRLSRLLDFFFAAREKRRRWRKTRGRRFIYQLEIAGRLSYKKALKLRFVSLRLVKLYYINYSYKQFRKLAKIIRRHHGVFETNFLLALESRAAPLLYRMTLLANPFHCLDFVRQGHLFVSSRSLRSPNHKVGLHKLITFTGLGHRWIYHELFYRLARRRLLFNVPSYITVSFFFLWGYQRRAPLRQDLIFPIALDFYRATGYAF